MQWLLQRVLDVSTEESFVALVTRSCSDEAERLRAWLAYYRRVEKGWRAAARPPVQKKPPAERLWNAVLQRARRAGSGSLVPYGDGSRSRLQRRGGVERVFDSFWANGGKMEDWQRGLVRDVGRVEFHAAGALRRYRG